MVITNGNPIQILRMICDQYCTQDTIVIYDDKRAVYIHQAWALLPTAVYSLYSDTISVGCLTSRQDPRGQTDQAPVCVR